MTTGLDFVYFDVTIPLVRRDSDGERIRQDVQLRIPSTDLDSAVAAATEIAYVIVANLPQQPDNNRHGWKAAYGVAVQAVKA